MPEKSLQNQTFVARTIGRKVFAPRHKLFVANEETLVSRQIPDEPLSRLELKRFIKCACSRTAIIIFFLNVEEKMYKLLFYRYVYGSIISRVFHASVLFFSHLLDSAFDVIHRVSRQVQQVHLFFVSNEKIRIDNLLV